MSNYYGRQLRGGSPGIKQLPASISIGQTVPITQVFDPKRGELSRLPIESIVAGNTGSGEEPLVGLLTAVLASTAYAVQVRDESPRALAPSARFLRKRPLLPVGQLAI